MAKKRKITGMEDALSLFSIWGFAALLITLWLNVELSAWQTPILMFLAGAGLFMEGNLMKIHKWAKDGIQKGEINKVVAIVVGMFAMIIGVLTIPTFGISNLGIDSLVSLVALISLVYLALDRWVF